MTAEFEKSAVEEPPCIHISLLQANPPNGSLFSALCRKVQNSMCPIGLIFDSFIHSRLDDGWGWHIFSKLCRKYLRQDISSISQTSLSSRADLIHFLFWKEAVADSVHARTSFHIWIVVLSVFLNQSIHRIAHWAEQIKGIGDKMTGVYSGERRPPTLSSFFRVSVVGMKMEPGIRINTTLDTDTHSHDAGGDKWKLRKLDQAPRNKTKSLLISK